MLDKIPMAGGGRAAQIHLHEEARHHLGASRAMSRWVCGKTRTKQRQVFPMRSHMEILDLKFAAPGGRMDHHDSPDRFHARRTGVPEAGVAPRSTVRLARQPRACDEVGSAPERKVSSSKGD